MFIGAGTTIAAIDNGNDIGGSSIATGNTITNWGGGAAPTSYVSLTGNNYCIFDNQQINDNISYNTITSAALAQSVTTGGILKNYSAGQPTGTITTTITNNIVTVTNNPSAATTGGVIGINNQGLSSLLATATMSLNNNTVQNCVLGGSTSTTNGLTGITNLSLPGTLNMVGNNILNNSITATSATSGVLVAMSNSGAAGTANMNNNIVRDMASKAASGQIQGIVNSGAVVTALNMNNNQLGNTTGGFFSSSVASSGSLFGISSSGGASTCSTTIQNNDLRGITYTVAASAAQNFLQSTAAVLSSNISSNTFTNLNINTTGATTFISESYTGAATATKTVTNNSIVTSFNRGGASGSVVLVTDGGSSVSGCVSNCTSNNFSNITVAGTSTITGFSFTDGGTAPTRTVTGNTFNNWTAITGTVNTMNFTYWNGVSSLSSNTITNITGQGAITGITIGSTINTATSIAIASNTINNLSSTGTGGNVIGINCSNTSPAVNISGNTINTLSSTNTSGVVSGISIGGASTTNIFKNKIYDLSGTQTGTTINGINIISGTTFNIFNNLIGDLKAPAATGLNAINGINASATSTYNVYYNTIYLNATSSSATTFGNSCITFSSSVIAFNNRNNILVNLSTPAQNALNVSTNGISACLRRSGGTSGTVPANYATTSNNNDFWCNPTAGTNNHLSYVEGTSTITNPFNTIAQFQIFLVNRDQISIGTNPSFTSTIGSSVDFLHINTTISTGIESGATNIATYTDDFDGTVRQGNPGYLPQVNGGGTAPDIGADEFDGHPSYSCTTPTPGNTLSTANNLCLGQSITLSLQNASVGTGITYQWQSSADGTAYSNVSGAMAASYTVTPAASQYYQCIVTCQNGPVSVTSTPVQITFLNSINSTLPGSRCGTGVVSLEATTGGTGTLKWYAAATGGSSIGLTGSPWTTPSISATTTYYVGAESSSAANITFGTGVTLTSSTNYPTAFGNRYYQDWSQMVYTAAELQAAGLSAGNITAISLNINAIGSSASVANYQILMGSTANSTLSGFTTTGLTTVYGPSTYTSAAGQNLITFSTPFVWDGTSNIILDIRGTGINSTYNATTYYTATTGNTVVYAYSGTNNASYYTSSPLATTSTSRLNVIFAGQSACSSPRSPVVATVNTAPALTLSINQTICNNVVATLAVTSNVPDYDSYIWTPQTGLFTDPACQTAYTGTNFSTVYCKSATAGVYTYTCNATNSTTQCANTNATTVTILPASPAIIANPASLCVSGSSVLTTSPATGYGTATFQWQNSPDNSLFTDIPGATSIGYTTPTITSTTYYKLKVSAGSGVCTESTATITVNSPQITGITPGTRCGTGTVNLAASASTGATLKWYAAASGGTALGTGSPFTTPSISATTNYYVAAENLGTTVIVGNGASTSSDIYTPFNGSYGGIKTQHLITAAELTSAGLSAGSITNLALEVTVSGTTYNGFYIQMGNTALNDFTATANIQGGLTTVYNVASVTPAVGTNTYSFASPFIWDGTSNVIVSISWSNANASNTASTVKVDPTTNYSSQSYRADSQTPAFILAFTGPTAGVGTLATSQNRPQIKFNYTPVCASARTTVIATVTTAPTISASSTPSTICAGTSATLEATSLNSGYSYAWSPATTPATGASVAASPVVTTLYTVTGTDNSGGSNNGCFATTTVTVTVIPSPSAVTITPAAAGIYAGSIQQLVASGGTNTGSGTIGTGNTSNTTSTPYKGYWGGNKSQFLFTASELTAMGLTSGSPITAITFSISAYTGPYTFNNFTIGMKNTSSTVLTTTIETGVTTVLTPATLILTGTAPFTKTHLLSTPFAWDGVSNLLVETCFVNADGGGVSANSATVVSTTTATNLSNYYSNDTETTVCSAPGIATTSTSRPNITFDFGSTANITWSPTTDLYIDNPPTLAYNATTYPNQATVYSMPAATTTYTATATSSANGCMSSKAVTVTVISLSTWVGGHTGNETEWAELLNWNPNAVPGASSDVVIPPTTYLPVVNQAPGSPALCYNLNINSGATVTVAPGKALTVYGTLTNGAGIGGILLKSDATGTGSLIQNTAGVNGTIERAMTDADWNNWIDGWHFLSSPVASQAVSAFASTIAFDYDFYCWQESSNLWVNYKNETVAPTWTTANGSANFTVGRGYLVAYNNPETKLFSGLMNVASVSKTGLTRTPASYPGGDITPGWNLLGNPFTSAISWNPSTWSLPTNIGSVSKIWNEINASYTDIGATGIIPATQGFMVEVISGTGSLTIPAAARTHSAQSWYKSTGNPYIKLVVHNLDEKTAQESIVTFDNQAAPGYDPAFDSHFLPGYAPYFYSVDGDEHLSTNVLPEMNDQTTVPFSFINTSGNSCSIEALQIDNVPAQVYLTDLKINKIQNLVENPVYTFTSTNGDDPARFLLSFSHVGINEKTQGNNGIYAYENNLYVVNPGKAKLEVYSLTGQKLLGEEINSPGLYKTTLYVPTGYYVVRLTTSSKVVVTKVFIKS
ncbi:MAG: hypothetical protein WCK09_06040 [Bacteroidota bacterium]